MPGCIRFSPGTTRRALHTAAARAGTRRWRRRSCPARSRARVPCLARLPAGGVVVEKEHRDDRDRALDSLPHRERVLGRDDVEFAAHVDQVLVPRRSVNLNRILGGRPQFVVARNPDDLCESAAKELQRPPNVVSFLGNISGENEPVVRRIRKQFLRHRLVAVVTDMNVAHRHQLCCHDPSASSVELPRFAVAGPVTAHLPENARHDTATIRSTTNTVSPAQIPASPQS